MHFPTHPQEPKGLKFPQPYLSSLHAIRKPQVKPWKKLPIAPLPPTPPKVYQVHPMNFRELVQKLTGSPKTNHRPPPPPQLDIALTPPFSLNETPSIGSEVNFNFQGDPYLMVSTSLDLNLSSPLSSARGLCSVPLVSPAGSLSSLEQIGSSFIDRVHTSVHNNY